MRETTSGREASRTIYGGIEASGRGDENRICGRLCVCATRGRGGVTSEWTSRCRLRGGIVSARSDRGRDSGGRDAGDCPSSPPRPDGGGPDGSRPRGRRRASFRYVRLGVVRAPMRVAPWRRLHVVVGLYGGHGRRGLDHADATVGGAASDHRGLCVRSHCARPCFGVCGSLRRDSSAFLLLGLRTARTWTLPIEGSLSPCARVACVCGACGGRRVIAPVIHACGDARAGGRDGRRPFLRRVLSGIAVGVADRRFRAARQGTVVTGD